MYKVERILCPTDFSEGSLQALSAATDIATKLGAELSVIHVLPVLSALPTDPNFVFEVHQRQDLLYEDMEKRLHEMTRESKEKGTQGRVFVEHGDAAGEIVRVAEEQRIDLIVIATFGKTGWRRLAFGSVTEKVVRLAPCPVLVVRGIEDRIRTEEAVA
jgi:nucleotide-binding universal stress UspA family protein